MLESAIKLTKVKGVSTKKVVKPFSKVSGEESVSIRINLRIDAKPVSFIVIIRPGRSLIRGNRIVFEPDETSTRMCPVLAFMLRAIFLITCTKFKNPPSVGVLLTLVLNVSH